MSTGWEDNAICWAEDGHRAVRGAIQAEQCGRGISWASSALGILAHRPQPLPLSGSGSQSWWGPVGTAPPLAFWAWLTLCILRCHRAVEPCGLGVILFASPACTPHLQAAPAPRAFCIPRIILTECAPNPPSPPEEPGPRTPPTLHPWTLTGSERGSEGPQASLGISATDSQPRSSSTLEKEGEALMSLGRGFCSPENGEAGAPCLWGPSLDRTQEPSAAKAYPKETPKDCSRECLGQPPAGRGCAMRGATTQRMDSLEETLRELEVMLSEMGTVPAVGPPGSPSPPPPGSQVAVPSPVLPSCLHTPVCLSSELEGEGGYRSTTPAPSSHWPSLSSCHPLGAWYPVGVCV
ncbi:uncharacterized protein LOC143687540 [Tamandua tetradactyla]|uniref:uncharacterized protein LOC143687540 n=1 Tax=Tamandua tetradactyla TaxID=48850 RepID=UPI004053B0E8